MPSTAATSAVTTATMSRPFMKPASPCAQPARSVNCWMTANLTSGQTVVNPYNGDCAITGGNYASSSAKMQT